MLEIIKNILVTLSTLILWIILYVKIFRNLFINIIEIRYQNIHEKPPISEITVLWISRIAMAVYIVLIFANIACIGIGVKWSHRFNISNYFTFNFRIGVLILFISSLVVYWSAVLFLEYRKTLICMIENKSISKIEKKHIRINKMLIRVSVIISVILLLLIGFVIIQSIETVRFSVIYFFENNIKNISLIAFLSLSILLNITIFIILISLKEVATIVNEEVIYILYTNKENIICKYFLEYEEYYLIFKNGIQKYIQKCEVYEIRKKELY